MTSKTVFVSGITVVLVMNLSGQDAVGALQAQIRGLQRIGREIFMVRDTFRHYKSK